jgi:DNA-binding HxlR family transcriptional regulator
MDPKYRVIVPKTAKGLFDELAKVIEAGQTEIIVVRGIVGSGKTRLLNRVCAMIKAKNFEKLEETEDKRMVERLALLKMKNGFGFNVELDQISIIAFEKRFHDAIIEFLADEEYRKKFHQLYNLKKSEIRKRYKSETVIATKLIGEMLDVLHSRFNFDYFLICVDEFDIILPQKYTGEDYRERVVNFLNGLNEISKEMTKRECPTLLVLLQTEYANKIFLDYIKGLSDATWSRISQRTDITLGYDFDEVKEFIISRLERERVQKVSDPLYPFSQSIVELLYREFEDKAEKKVLSLRTIEKSLLDLLEMGISQEGKITIEMAQQVATKYAPEAKPSEALYTIPPIAIESARKDLAKMPVERANILATCIEKIFKPDPIRNILTEIESVDVTNDFAILRIFYEFGRGNETYDLAVLYAVFREKINTDLQRRIGSCYQLRPYPQSVIIFLHAPLQEVVPSFKNAHVIMLTGKDMELLFATNYLTHIPPELSKEFGYINGRVSEILAHIKDIPKTSTIPIPCVRAFIGVVSAYIAKDPSIEKIKEFLEIIYNEGYETTLSQHLSRLIDWGLIVYAEKEYKPTIPNSIAHVLSYPEGYRISSDIMKEMFPGKRFKNMEMLCIGCGFLIKEGNNYIRCTRNYWRQKLLENYEFITKRGKTEDKNFKLAQKIEKLSTSAQDPWDQITMKCAFDICNLTVTAIKSTEQTIEEKKKQLQELKSEIEALKPSDALSISLQHDLLSRVQKALASPENVDIDSLKAEYEGLKASIEATEIAPSQIAPSQAEKVLEHVPIALGIPELPTTLAKIEQAILDCLKEKSMTLQEIYENIPQYSRDVLKTTVINLLEKGTVRLTKGV